MRILLNGQEHLLEQPCTVASLLASLGLTEQRVAVERNLEIVSRSQYAETVLQEDDHIEIVHAIGGGAPLFR